jgi:cellulose synthase/poly-beta-1,6-N-acetylglucosamine synthase-like glycosyltransferase
MVVFQKTLLLKTLSLHGKPKKINLVNYNPDAICFTEDPEPLKSYIKQVQRWFSWRPSVKKHFKEVRKGLKFTILWVIGESLDFLLYLGIIIYLLATFQWLQPY